MWVICISCHHRAELKPLPKRRLRCTVCGSSATRAVRVVMPSMVDGGQLPADTARRLMHAGLVSIAAHRGHKPGWAAMKYKAIYGTWPADDKPAAQDPSSELLRWIRKQNREYARTRPLREIGAPIFAAEPISELASPLMQPEDYDVDL